MSKIAADANPFAKAIERGAIGASFLVIESEMAMDEVANRLNPLPARLCLAKSPPSEIDKLAVNLKYLLGKRNSRKGVGISESSDCATLGAYASSCPLSRMTASLKSQREPGPMPSDVYIV